MTILPQEAPLLTIQKAVIVFVSSYILCFAIFILNVDNGRYLRQSIMTFFFVGHIFLALIAAKGRLSVKLPVDRSWLDLFAVAGACWVGPLVWYYQWRKARKK